MSDLLDAIENVATRNTSEAKINIDALNSDFFSSEIKQDMNTISEPVLNNPSDAKTKIEEPAKPANATNTGENSLDSRMIINFMDVVLSRLLQVGFSFGGIETSAKDFTLTPEEVKKIEPAASVVLNKYGMNLSPEWLLVLLVVSIYGAKIIMVLPEGRAKGDVKKARIKATKEEAKSTNQSYSGAKRGPKPKLKPVE